MARITPANALKLSAWLAVMHPGLFRQLLAKTSALQSSPFGRFGLFGDDVPLQDVGLDIPDVSVDTTSAIDTAALTDFSPDLAPVDTAGALDIPIASNVGGSIDQALGGGTLASPDSGSSTDASFWSSIGSGAASVAGAVGKVASALLAPATLSAAATAAGAYFKSQATTTQAQLQAQTQQAVLNAQLARVAQGGAPAPISYARNAYGQLVPVYNSPAGSLPVTSSMLSGLANPVTAGLSSVPTSVWLIGAGLLILSVFVSSRSS